MESDDDMVLSMVKGHLTHLKIKKVDEEECKDPLAWWKTHELQFFYVGFVWHLEFGKLRAKCGGYFEANFFCFGARCFKVTNRASLGM